MTSLCQACNNPAQETCSRCHCSRYCSKECQKADWPTHKLLCRQYSNFDLASRPSEGHVLAIIFSPDKDEPHLFWLQSTEEDTPSNAFLPYLFPDGYDRPQAEGPHLLYSQALDRDLSDGVFVYWRDEFFYDGSIPNRAVKAATKERRSPQFDWRGPFIVCGTVGRRGFRLRDTNLLDFRHAVDYLRARNNIFHHPQVLGGRIQAIRINCKGAQETHNLPLFQPIIVPTSFQRGERDGDLIMPTHADQPLRMRRDPDDPSWQGSTPARNDAARMLRLGCSDSERWPREQLGSVVVMRMDHLPLDPQYVEAMVCFCEEVAPRFVMPLPMEVVLATISKPAFDEFYARFLQQKEQETQTGSEGV